MYRGEFQVAMGADEEKVWGLSEGGECDYRQRVYDVMAGSLPENSSWEDSGFDEARAVIAEQDGFVVNPVEVVEGLFKCRCGSKKTFSFQKQTRSSDESITVFITCAQCQHRWVEG